MTGGSLVPESMSRRLVPFYSEILVARRRRAKAARRGSVARHVPYELVAKAAVEKGGRIALS